MENNTITVDVTLDAKTFRDFAVFDNLILRRRWLFPTVFALIFLVFSCICFIARTFESQATLLGCVLLVIGFGLPAVYFSTFFRSIRFQIKKLDFEKEKHGYVLKFSKNTDSIHVSNSNGESTKYKWVDLYGVYYVANYIYLYVHPKKAFIIPANQVNSTDLWLLFSSIVPAKKLHDRRRIKSES